MSHIRFEDYTGKLRTHEAIKPPVIEYVWYAYKSGVAHVAGSRREAAALSMNFEKVATKESQAAFDTYWSELRALECEAVEAWGDALRRTYANIPARVYNRLMSEAWDRGHSAGYDEIANALEDLVVLAVDLKRLWER